MSFTGTRYLNSGIRYQPRYQNSENQVLVIPVPALCLIQVQVYLVPASIPIPGSAQPLIFSPPGFLTGEMLAVLTKLIKD